MAKKMTCQICHQPMRLNQSRLFDDRYGAPGLHDIYRCIACGFGKTAPGLTRAKIGQFYTDHYPLSVVDAKTLKSQIRLISPWRAWFEGVDNTTHWQTRKGQKVLDIGSASGVSLLEIKALGGIAYGVEPDPHGARVARQLKLNVHQGFITDLPFQNIQFDLITGSQVLEHEPDPKKFLRSAGKKLVASGQLVLSLPNYDALYRHIFRRRWIHWHIPYHLNFFTRKSLSLLADQAGLEVVTCRTITPNLWTIMQLRALFTPIQEGRQNPIWTQAVSTGDKAKKNLPTATSLLHRVIVAAVRFSVWIVMPINRLVDALGMGESYLIILQKKTTK